MKVIYGINNIGKLKGSVVAMGVFDGVHRGHRRILEAVSAKAHEIGSRSVVVTFYPHPQRKESLYSLEHRLRLIAELGIDICVVANFSSHFSRMSAKGFVKDILVDKIGASLVYVGRDFRFGYKIKGDFILLEKMGKIYDFKARGFSIVKIRGIPVSSTLIRKLIRNGDIRLAQKFLARPVSILGTVVRGTKIGRLLGFPTANINPHHEVIPSEGIYAVRIILDKKEFKGACYIGTRPTISPQHAAGGRREKVNVEVHIFSFRKNIYGKYLEIQFIRKIRPDKKFSSLGLLSKQIQKDVIRARQILS
ncbi:MAG: riboflavin biosynthesis protein RibF [Candidatus Omnitrophota bacterium]